MTKQIDELMALVNDLLFAPNHLRKKKSQALRTALESALKPGNVASKTRNPKYPWKPSHGWDKCMKCFEDSSLEPCNHCGDGYPDQYLDALPAQTPPPQLSDEQISDIAISTPPNVHAYGRAIETAVRKQMFNNLGQNK
jgi:hypothetical protein